MTEPALSIAEFTAKTDARGREIPEERRRGLPVHFNPESLDITYTNTVQKGNRNQPAQVVNETTAKLSMELVYDTSLNGTDVRADTHRIASMMDPAQQTPRRRNARSMATDNMGGSVLATTTSPGVASDRTQTMAEP